MNGPARGGVLVLTALDLEYQAVRAHLSGLREYSHPAGTLFETGQLPDGGRITLAVTGEGNPGAAVLAERAITMFGPQAVMFVGVAGSLKDDVGLAERIRHLLDLLTAIDAPAPARVAPAVGIEPAMLLSEGRVADLPRARATIGHRRAPHVRVPAEDALPFAGLTGRSPDVAEELAARLLARFRQERS